MHLISELVFCGRKPIGQELNSTGQNYELPACDWNGDILNIGYIHVRQSDNSLLQEILILLMVWYY